MLRACLLCSTIALLGCPGPGTPVDRFEVSNDALPDIVCPCQQEIYGGASEVSCRMSLAGLRPDFECYRRGGLTPEVEAFIECAAAADEAYLECLGGVCEMGSYVTCSAVWDLRRSCASGGDPTARALLAPCSI